MEIVKRILLAFTAFCTAVWMSAMTDGSKLNGKHYPPWPFYIGATLTAIQILFL